jgi:triphosphatase
MLGQVRSMALPSVIMETSGCAAAASKFAQPQAVQPAPLEIDRRLSGELVLECAGRGCLDHLARNTAAGYLGDAEGIHQMRAAVRRLRAVFFAFARCLPPESRRWASNELRWIAEALGEARDLDVFASALLAPARAALPASSEFERLARAIDRRRQSAHAAAREAISSTRYAGSVQALTNWFDGRGWRASGQVEELRRAIGELAPMLLERCRRQAKKRGKRLEQSEEQRHQLRIALKKLRYASELLGSLYDPAETRQFIGRVKRLQDDLGDINDVRVGRDIVASLAGSGVTGIGYAGRRMLAWHKRRLAHNEPRLRRHLQQLIETKPFWQSNLAFETAQSDQPLDFFEGDQ